MKKSGLIVYDGKAYRNLETVKEEIKLSFGQRLMLLISPKMVIHTNVYCQAEIEGGKVVTIIDNETYLSLTWKWFREKFPQKVDIVEVEQKDSLALPLIYKFKCLDCSEDIEVVGEEGKAPVYCPNCLEKYLKT